MTKTSPKRARSREARVPKRVTEKRIPVPEPLRFVGGTETDSKRGAIRVPVHHGGQRPVKLSRG